MAESDSRQGSSLSINSDQLNGWGQIAQYLGQSVRTAQRWEKHHRLPVHRIHATGGRTIFALRSELDAWRDSPSGESAAASGVVADDIPVVVGNAERGTATVESSSGATGREPAWPAWRSGRAWLAIAGLFVALSITAVALWARQRDALVLQPESALASPQGATFLLTVRGVAAGDALERWTRFAGKENAMLPLIHVYDGPAPVQWAFSTDCTTRPGLHRLYVREGSGGRSSNVIDVDVTSNPICERPLPDLVASGVELPFAEVRAGRALSFSFTIGNEGAAPAVATVTRVRLGRSSARSGVSDQALGDVDTAALAAGERVRQSATVTIPAGTAPGEYFVWIVADNRSATVERLSSNNFAHSVALRVR